MINKITRILKKTKELLKNSERHTLSKAIGEDFFQYGKIPLCIFIFIVITAVKIVTITHYTRLSIIKREQLISEYEVLDTEWRNLILKNAIIDQSSKKDCNGKVTSTSYLLFKRRYCNLKLEKCEDEKNSTEAKN